MIIMIQKLALGAKILLCILSGFFVLMSIDVFEVDATLWERIGGFFISISPGLILISIVLLFWKKERPLAFMSFGLALVWLVFLIIKGNFPEMIGGVLIVDIPLVISGTILLISSKKLKE